MSGRPARGEATRAALIDAAISVFGRDGYEAATTKGIAAEAGANQALISYYFGGKEGLYAAAVEHIAAQIGNRMGPLAHEVEAEMRRLDATRHAVAASAGYLDLLCLMLNGFVELLTSDESAPWARLIVREQQEPTAAFELLYERVQRRLLDVVAALVCRIRGRSTPSAADRLTVITIVGQALVFRMARAAATRYLGWESIRPQEVARIKAALRHNVAALLGVVTE